MCLVFLFSHTKVDGRETMTKITRSILCLFAILLLGVMQVTAAEESGTLVITGTPVDDLEKYGFVLYKDLRENEKNDELVVWLTKEENWKTELKLPYGKYYALVDDTAILPKDIETPVNCRYILRFGDSPFYETYEINAQNPVDGKDKEPIILYLVSTVSGGAGSKVTSIGKIEEEEAYKIGENEEALAKALDEIEVQESLVDQSLAESKEEPNTDTPTTVIDTPNEQSSFIPIIVTIAGIIILLITVIGCLILYHKKNEDE